MEQYTSKSPVLVLAPNDGLLHIQESKLGAYNNGCSSGLSPPGGNNRMNKFPLI